MGKQGIEYEIYHYSDYSTIAGILPGRRDPKVLDELKSVGGGSFRISKNDPKILENPNLRKGRNLVRVKIDGLPVSAFLMGDRDSTSVDGNEHSGLDYEIAGPGLKQLFDDARIEPVGGIKPESRSKRVFNFASEQGDWYSPGAWVNPVVYSAVRGGSYYGGTTPQNWPAKAPDARWIWGIALTPPAPGVHYGTHPAGDCYFRYTVNIATAGLHAIYSAVDDFFELYVDGEKIASSDSPTFANASRVEVTLTTGTHVIAYRVTNQSAAGPAALGHALSRVIDPENETFIGYSGASGWKALPYPSVVPAWTPGELLGKLIDEAQARGVDSYDLFVPTFTSTLDSNGVAWPAELKVEWSFTVGESMLSVVSKLEEAGVDIWVDPVNFELNMVPTRGVDRTVFQFSGAEATQTPVEFTLGKDIRSAKTKAKSKIKNNLLLKTEEGFFTTQDTTSVTEYGRIEATLDTGASKALATTLAELVFAQRAKEEEGASYDLLLTTYIPYVHFNIGDWVLAPDEQGVSVKRRVMSISTAETNSGNVVYTIEFDTIFKDNEDRLNRVIAKLGGGGVGGSLANNAGSTPGVGSPIIIPPSTGPSPVIYPLAPDDLTAVVSGSWTPDGVTPIAQVLLGWTAVTQDIEGNPVVVPLYDVEGWRMIGGVPEAGSPFGTTPLDEVLLQPFAPGETWQFKVRAVSDTGTRGDWSTPIEVEMTGPDTPMLAPEAPVPTSHRGVLSLQWNGLLDGDVTPPPQFRYVYAELSSTGPDGPWTRMGQVLFREGRNIAITDLTVLDEYWARFRAVDGVGLISEPSSWVSHIIQGIVGPDIMANSVDANVITAGSIKTNQLAPEVGEELNLSANGSINLVVGEAVTEATGDIRDNLEEMQTYYKFGAAGAEISKPGSVFSLALRNDRIEMLENGAVVSYWNSGTMYVNQFVGEDVILGNHQIAKYEDGTVVRAL